jgi:hypothetical protein
MATMKRVFIIAVLLIIPALAKADSVWTYTGNSVSNDIFAITQPPNPCGCALDGFVTLDANNVVTGYSFTAAGDTLTQSNSTGLLGRDIFAVFNPADDYFRWAVFITGNDGVAIHSNFDGSNADSTDSSSNGLFVDSNPGTWSLVSTPEPSSIILLGAGLTALALVSSRFKF